MIVLYLLLILHTTNAIIPYRTSTNTLVIHDKFILNHTSADPDKFFYAVNAGFGPSVWEDGTLDSLSILLVDDCCSHDKLYMEAIPKRPFVVVTKRSGCSYELKARNAERINASALILINREYQEGLLFPPLPELTYYSKPDSQSIRIPVMLIKKGDGNMINNVVSNNTAFVSIYCAKVANRTLIHAWNFHWIFWAGVFSVLLILSTISFVLVCQIPQINPVIRPCILLTAIGCMINVADMLTDHWNIRGILSEAVFQTMYWLELDALLYKYIITQWLWYRMLDEKDLLKHKGVVINKPTIYAIVILMVLAGILKIIMIACGVTVVTSWRVYDVILIMLACTLGTMMVISGFRIRRRLHRAMNKTKGTFKLTLMMVVGNIGIQISSLSLFIWMVFPNVFGVWSWFVYNFFWRFAAAFLSILFLIVYGTKLPDKKVKPFSVDDSSKFYHTNSSFTDVEASSAEEENAVKLQTFVNTSENKNCT